jgi:predicted secreted Zn-dependent protease
MALMFQPSGNVPATRGVRLDDATLRDLVRNRSGQELGHTTFSITWNGPPPDAAGRFTSLDVTFTLRIEMPVWASYPRRPEAEKREWDRFYRALLWHEQGHVAIIKRAAQTTYQRLLAATKDTINNVAGQETQRIHRANAAYDSQTDHGRRQNSPHGTTIIVVPQMTNAPPPGCTPGWPARPGAVGR